MIWHNTGSHLLFVWNLESNCVDLYMTCAQITCVVHASYCKTQHHFGARISLTKINFIRSSTMNRSMLVFTKFCLWNAKITHCTIFSVEKFYFVHESNKGNVLVQISEYFVQHDKHPYLYDGHAGQWAISILQNNLPPGNRVTSCPFMNLFNY